LKGGEKKRSKERYIVKQKNTTKMKHLQGFGDFASLNENFALNENYNDGDDQYLVVMGNLLDLADTQREAAVAKWLKKVIDDQVKAHVQLHGEKSLSQYKKHLETIKAKNDHNFKVLTDRWKKDFPDMGPENALAQLQDAIKRYPFLRSDVEKWDDFLIWFFDTFPSLAKDY